VQAAYAAERGEVVRLLPAAEVEHIGATAVPGSLTKGDLDLLVRVPAADFAPAAELLGSRYEIHQPENWTAGLASFKRVPEGEIPVGVQLVAIDGEFDRLALGWRERLRSSPALLRRYNEVKRAHRGSTTAAYRAAKARLIEAEM